MLWLVVATGVVVVAVFPSVLVVAAEVAGVQTPSNLLFFVAALVLLIVSVQLSAEVSRLEDETRCLAEEMALLRMQVECVLHIPNPSTVSSLIADQVEPPDARDL